MKALVLPFMLLSLAAGTVGVIKTVEMMDNAAEVMVDARQCSHFSAEHLRGC